MAEGTVVVRGGDEQATLVLNAVTGPTTGAPLDFSYAKKNFSLVVTTTGLPAAGTVKLYVSVDGVSFVDSGVSVDVSVGTPSMASLSGVAFRWARVDLASLSGGTAPTVTAKIMTAA